MKIYLFLLFINLIKCFYVNIPNFNVKFQIKMKENLQDKVINLLDTQIPINNYNKLINDQSIKVFEPYNIKKNKINSVLFFTGGNSIIPGEVYTEFLSTLARNNLSVHVSNNNLKISEILGNYLLNNYNSTIILAHSTGCVNAIRCSNLLNISKIILMDPVDNRFLVNNGNKNKNLYVKEFDYLLFLNAKRSYEWRFYPNFTFPFIPAFAIKPNDIDYLNENYNLINANKFGHSDILDMVWSNFMHSTVSKGLEERNFKNLNIYHEWISKIVNYIILDNSQNKNYIMKVLKSKDFNEIDFEID